jgi:transposase
VYEAAKLQDSRSHFITKGEKMEATKTRVVGIDLAKRSYVAHAIDPAKDRAVIWEGRTDEKGIDGLCAKLRPSDRVAIECCSYAFYLVKVLTAKVGCRVLVLNAGDLAVIFKSVKKTDLEDAGKLAWLLSKASDDELPVVTPPSEKEEHRRALVSELSSKKKARTALINRLHSLFVRQGIVTVGKEDLRTADHREAQLASLGGYTGSEAKRVQQELILLESHIDEIEAEIKLELRGEPKVSHLMSIPGVGPTTAIAFLAYVGVGNRFSSARQVSHYVGITPRVDSSGDTTRIGGITKRGCTAIRALIVQSAWAAVHTSKDHSLKRKYQELATRRGKGRAIVAVARRLLELMWVLLRTETFYWETTNEELKLKMARAKVA